MLIKGHDGQYWLNTYFTCTKLQSGCVHLSRYHHYKYENNMLIINNAGVVYMFNIDGQPIKLIHYGISYVVLTERSVYKIDQNSNITRLNIEKVFDIAYNGQSILALKEDGLYVKGRSGLYFGLSDDQLHEFTRINFNLPIKSFTLGTIYVIIVTQQDEVYGCGVNANGELSRLLPFSITTVTKLDLVGKPSTGNGNLFEIIDGVAYFRGGYTKFKRVDIPEEVVHIETSNQHAVLYTADKIYALSIISLKPVLLDIKPPIKNNVKSARKLGNLSKVAF